MRGTPVHEPRPGTRFAAPPWHAQSTPWRQSDAQLPPAHLAREMRQAMTHLDWTELSTSYAGRGTVPHRPALLLAIVLFDLRRGQRQPSPWLQDTPEHGALWWLGSGVQPSRRGWYAFRDRPGPYVDRLNKPVLPPALEAERTRVERGA